MRRGFAPSRIPTAGTTFPLDTFLFNASLFSFSRGRLYSLPPSRFQRATSLMEGGSYARQPANLLSWQSQLGTNRCVEMNNMGHASM